VERTNSRKKSVNDSLSYQQLKFNSSSASKDRRDSRDIKETRDIRSNFSSIELPRKQTPLPVHTHTQQSSEGEKAPYGLVQN
jgi:hypothetical protein